jgi:hypothetical protein
MNLASYSDREVLQEKELKIPLLACVDSAVLILLASGKRAWPSSIC